MVKVSQVNSVHYKYWTCILKWKEYRNQMKLTIRVIIAFPNED